MREKMTTKVKLRKNGNSFCATLPRKFLKSLGIKDLDIDTIRPIISMDGKSKKIIIDFEGAL